MLKLILGTTHRRRIWSGTEGRPTAFELLQSVQTLLSWLNITPNKEKEDVINILQEPD